MVTKSVLTRFGLTKDENNLKLKEVFKDNIRLKEIHIDTYSENPLIASSAPFMLLLRLVETGAIVSKDEDRLVLKRNDGLNTYFVNILFSQITECYYKVVGSCSFEFILKVQNIYYRIIVFN